jgi:hypothetical protein
MRICAYRQAVDRKADLLRRNNEAQSLTAPSGTAPHNRADAVGFRRELAHRFPGPCHL